MANSNMSFIKAGEILKKNLKRSNVSESLTAAMLFNLWPKVAAKLVPFAQESRPRTLKGRILTIATTSHIQAAELRLKAPALLREINILAGKKVVERLVFKIIQ